MEGNVQSAFDSLVPGWVGMFFHASDTTKEI